MINAGDENNDYDFDVTDMIDTFVKCVITVRSEHEDTVGDGRVGPLILNQSISSLKWQEDAKEYLNVLIDLIESRDYSDRIIGYHIGYAPPNRITEIRWESRADITLLRFRLI